MGRDAGVFSACVYVPFDLRWLVRQALQRVKPRALVLEALEIWPNLLLEAQAAGVPVLLVNGRLSARSLRAYERFAALFRPIFRQLAFVSAVDEVHAARFASAGVPPARITVNVSSKHAVLPPSSGGRRPRHPRLVFGSVHPVEARLIVPVLPDLLARLPALEIVIVPRRMSFVPQLVRDLRARGLKPTLASAAAGQGPAGQGPGGQGPAGQGRVVVHDRFGGLRDEYGRSSLAFIGGSLVAHGGHNVVEAAACGLPVLVGPHVENCRREVERLQRGGAAWVVHTATELARHVEALVVDVERLERAGLAARREALKLSNGAQRLAPMLLAACGKTRFEGGLRHSGSHGGRRTDGAVVAQ